MQTFPIYWLTGNTGAGKSTLATAVQRYVNASTEDTPLTRRALVLDGDEMRATISTEESLSAHDRRRHNHRVARLAKHLADQGFLVLVSVIAPFADLRAEIDTICAPHWIYVRRKGLAGEDRPYEPPETPHLLVDCDTTAAEEAAQHLISYIQKTAL